MRTMRSKPVRPRANAHDRRPSRARAVGIALAIAAAGAAAAPEEIQVYLDDVNEPRELGLEMHVNYVLQGPRTPDYPGQQPANHVLQFTPEFSYGIAPNWEVGLYLLSSIAPGGVLNGNGTKLRLKYIAPGEGGFFWGMNGEIGYSSRRVSENHVNAELRPILGWRSGPWLFAVNPIVDLALSGDVSRTPMFAPAIKVARKLGEGTMVGIEHHADMGPLRHLPSFNEQSHLLFGVLDIERKGFDLNFGIGHGITAASEKWVVKMIVGIPLR